MNVDMAYKLGTRDRWMIWEAVLIFVILLIAVMMNAASAGAATCAYSSGSFANSALSQSEVSSFRIAYDAMPSSSSMNAISGLSSGSAQEYSDLAAGVRFNPSGTIDVRSGSSFTAAASIPYQGGTTYHFILDVNVSNHTYTAYVVILSRQITLGTNLAFRIEQSSVSVLNDLGVMSSAGSLSVCNIALSSSSTTVAASPSTLSANVSSLNFGNTGLASSKQLSATLTNTGSSSVTISGVSVSGAGFTASGSASGLTVSAGKSVAVQGTFNPYSIGTATGSIRVSSNAKNSAVIIAMSGTGIASSAHSVALSWNPSSSTVAGYNIYVGSSSRGPFSLLNSSPIPTTDYVDTTVQAGSTYYFYITSVSSSYQESAPSMSVQATVP